MAGARFKAELEILVLHFPPAAEELQYVSTFAKAVGSQTKEKTGHNCASG
jgi:hypothetical protein